MLRCYCFNKGGGGRGKRETNQNSSELQKLRDKAYDEERAAYSIYMSVKNEWMAKKTALNKIGLTLFRNVLRALIMKKKECVLRHKRRILLIIGFNRKVLKSKIHNNYGHKNCKAFDGYLEFFEPGS